MICSTYRLDQIILHCIHVIFFSKPIITKSTHMIFILVFFTLSMRSRKFNFFLYELKITQFFFLEKIFKWIIFKFQQSNSECAASCNSISYMLCISNYNGTHETIENWENEKEEEMWVELIFVWENTRKEVTRGVKCINYFNEIEYIAEFSSLYPHTICMWNRKIQHFNILHFFHSIAHTIEALCSMYMNISSPLCHTTHSRKERIARDIAREKAGNWVNYEKV